MSFPTPWGAYVAGHSSNTSTSLYDFTSNGRNATISGTAIVNSVADGNGATASIPYFTGTPTTEIVWPAGSIPTTFTICSITRYNGGTKKRILTSAGNSDNLHGHWGNGINPGYSGVAFYSGWKSPSPPTQSSYVGQNDWVVMCGTNSTGIAVPNNIFVNGNAVGGANGGTGNLQLSINSNIYNEDSDFAFNHVLIWNQALTVSQMQIISQRLMGYLYTRTIQYPWLVGSTNIPNPWCAYVAGHGTNTSSSLYDFAGNARNATISGTAITNTTGSGSGATASIPYFTGTTSTNITWPDASIPYLFTMCSITRYNGGTKKRILDSTNGTTLHGHWEGKSGIAYYGGFKTAQSQSSAVGLDNWVVMCGTNDLNISTPNNILINGTASGTENGGSRGLKLYINRDEVSDFAFQQVLIWEIGLTTTQMQTVSQLLLNYLSTGSIIYPWINTIVNPPVYFPIPWGAYIAGHDKNTSSSLYDFTGNARNATISGTAITNTTGSGSGATASIPYFTGTPSTRIRWPSNSVSAVFTICSITRYNGGTMERILDSDSNVSILHGHWEGKSGIAYYNGFNTSLTQSGAVARDNWVVMCGTNSTDISIPNNILVNNSAVGTSNGGTGVSTLHINRGGPSDFAFNQVLIWNRGLTSTQMQTVSSALMNYLSSGIMTYPWLQLPIGTGFYYNFNNVDVNNKSLNLSTGIYDLIRTGSSNISISTTYTKFRYPSLYRSIADSTVGQNYYNTSKTIGSSFTIAFWVRPINGNGSNSVIRLNTQAPYILFYLANGSSAANLIQFRVLNDNADYYMYLKTTGLSAGITWNADDWNHIAFIASCDGTNTSIDVYYNGSLVNYEFYSQGSGLNTSTNNVTAPTSSTDSVKVNGTIYSSEVVNVYFMGDTQNYGVTCYLSNVFLINTAITKSDLNKLIKYNYIIDITTNLLYNSNDIANITYLLQNDFNNGFNQNYYLTNSNSSLNNLMLYVYGTRIILSSLFKIKSFEILKYFQQDSVTYADELGNYTLSRWGTQSTIFKYARWIWNDPNAATTAVTRNVNLWFYYTFYYNGAGNTGTVYGMCDDYAIVWFNGTSIGSINGGFGTDSTGTSYSINIVNGLNYIRVAAYNGILFAGLLVALYDSNLNHITSSSCNWVVTMSSIYNMGDYAFNEIYIITVTGLSYNTGGSLKYPLISGYNVLYITGGTGTVTISSMVNIVNIFAVGGGSGGNSGNNRSSPAGGGKISNNSVNISGSYVFSISIGSGGESGSPGSNTTFNCSELSIAYTASGGTTSSISVATQNSYNLLYYGGAGGDGNDSGSSGSNKAPLGGGGGGAGNGGSMITASNGGNGGGISVSITGGNGGAANGGSGENSPYGGGGGAGGTTRSGNTGTGGNGGSGLGSGTAYDYDRILSNNTIKHGAGGSGGVNTGGGGGAGAGGDILSLGGKGGSGIVVIVYT